ncbi:MAG TPA: hypothetical protein DCZ69_17075, partial [Syntrophobacteraceae bacterium]|nr:hypothetical protein [Syntrophobacteraceae bacterium]
LRLPVFHILEPEMKQAIPADVYEQQAGFMELIVDTEELGKRFREARRSLEQNG